MKKKYGELIMRGNQKAKNDSIEEPKKKLEKLLVLSAFLIGYFYIYVYQNMLNIKVELFDFQTLIQMPLIALVIIPLIHYLIIKPDPLQRSPSRRKPIRFFQNEFPSKYILERCRRCTEDENSCKNYIKAESFTHVKYWFDDIFHGAIEEENPRVVKDTFAKGYTCKLLYYLSWILGIFFVLGILITIFHHIYLYFFDSFKVELISYQILFPLGCIILIILIKSLNKPNDKAPSGCWQAWREINRIHVSWLKSHEDLLVNLICQSGGGTKRFEEK